MKNLFFPAALVLCSVVPTNAAANEDGLYQEPLPTDAVFIRWIGAATSSADPIFAHAFAHSDMANEAYVAVSNALLEGASSGAYYSVVMSPEGSARVIEEPARANKAKVHVILLNASETPVALELAANGAEVIAPTESGMAQSRAVNPVSAELAVVPADGSPEHAFDVALRRGQNITFAVVDGTARVIENRFGAVIKAE